ncbi:alpha/beta hydrolase [Naasia lichenicola]|uniref:Esterase n=1 Tax=Naasia lichenicola TaxID=2565933 RepID=A0A4S4FID4_9MICO|nr:dienelactone hydrolase family protein [Naasia lichenicola]THG29828.1 esterase [Naasia lichenicola]
MALADLRSDHFPFTAADAPPVLLLLHGYGSSEHDLAGLGPALDLDLPWASLRAPVELGNGGAAWLRIVTPGNPDPESVSDATDAIWAWIDSELPGGAPVIPIGFSQGGLMASQLLRTRPERVLGTVILGGFVQGAEQPSDELLTADRPLVFWGRGANDGVIAEAAIQRTTAWLPEHSTLTERIYPGLGHGINRDELADVAAFVRAALDRSEALAATGERA